MCLQAAWFVHAGLSAVSAMAVDWLASNLYIVDVALRQVVVCSLRGQHACSVLASLNASHGSLRSVAVDPAARYKHISLANVVT